MKTSSTSRRGSSKRVTISLPESLFSEMERVRRTERLDRSAWVQRAVDNSLAVQRRAHAERAYVESYRNDPEEDPGPAVLSRLAAIAWADLDE